MNPKICLSIGNISVNEVLDQLKGVALAEIRIDLLNLTDDELATIFNQHKNLIATYRLQGDNDKMETLLTKAIHNGCAYIDIDIETPLAFRNRLIEKGQNKGCKVILSYHNFAETPDSKMLNDIIENLFESKADLAKIACMANSEEDCDRVLELYSKTKNLIAFCMGEIGKRTRFEALKMGAPFTYASIEGKETAPGQISYDEMESLLKVNK